MRANNGNRFTLVAAWVLLGCWFQVQAQPFAATQQPTLATSTSATLNGMATPNGTPTTAWFEWGSSTAYGQVTTPTGIGAGGSVTTLSWGISNLIAGQVYHCRLVVTNAAGTVRGADVPFVTGGNIAAWGWNNVGQATVPAGLGNVVAAAGGNQFSMALLGDGTVTAWGSNGDGVTNVPPGLNPTVAIAAGWAHALALLSNATVVCWGNNGSGQTNVPVGLSNVVAIAGGGAHSLALREDGTVVAWGAGTNNTGSYPDFGQSIVPNGLSNVVAVAAGGDFSLALRNDGTLLAWGDDTSGQTDIPQNLDNVVAIAAGVSHSLAVRSDGTVVAWGTGTTNTGSDPNYGQSIVPAGLNNAVGVAAGADDTLVLKSDGTAVGWGYDIVGEADVPPGLRFITALGGNSYHSLAVYGNTIPTAFPQGVTSVGSTDQIITLAGMDADGDGLTYRITTFPIAGTLYQYLNGTRGPVILAAGPTVSDPLGRVIFAPAQGGWGIPYATFAFVANDGQVDSSPAVVAISIPGPPRAATLPPAGITTTGAVLNGMATPNGTTTTAWFEWGTSSSYGQTTSPGAVGAGGAVVRLSTSLGGLVPLQIYHCRLVVSNALGIVRGWDQVFMTGGKILGWGDNADPYGSRAGEATPPPGLGTVSSFAAGGYHSLALRPDGSVVAWGYNSSNQTNVPAGLGDVIAVAGGGYHSLALRNDGTVVAWGASSSGQITVPPGLNNVVSIAAGANHSLALRGDGTVAAWGDDYYHQVDVPGDLSNVVAIAGGSIHSVALRNDGTVVAWGDDSFGQTDLPQALTNVVAIATGNLGQHSLALRSDGTVITWGNTNYGLASVPPGLTNAIAISAGGLHSLSLRNDGTALAWGYNGYGQTQVPGSLDNAVAIAAGGSHSLALGPNTPPSASPQTATGPANNDLVIRLVGSDPNGDSLSFRIAALPAAGSLYQYAAGSRGTQITAANTLVTDPADRVVFAPALNGLGSPYDSFAFVANDGEADSAPAAVSVVILGIPYAATQAATAISETAATLNGMATPNGFGSLAWFEWGTNLAYGQSTGPLAAGSGATVVRVSTAIASLFPAQLYHCRLVVSNANGLTLGADQAFITAGRVLAWGESDAVTQPGVLLGLTNVVGLAAGTAHGLALRSDQTVVAWGDDSNGQTNVPPGLGNVVEVAARGSDSVALLGDGTVVAWNNSYWLRDLTNVPAGLGNVVDVAAGASLNVALRADGTLVAWGYNSSGETNIPTGLSNVVAIAAGADHGLALRNDGTVAAWGANYSGQINVPAGLSNVVAITGGDTYSLALRRDGTVVGWGALQAPPAGLTNVAVVAAGNTHTLALLQDGSVAAWGAGQTNNPSDGLDFGQSIVPPGLGSVAALAAGGAHSLVLAGNQVPVAMPQAVSGSLNTDLTITLLGSDLDQDVLSFRITALPAAGKLYQYAGGVPGAPILAPDTPVTDAAGRVIFAPDPAGFGFAYSSFTFVANDGQADSQPATVTINVGLPFAATQPATGVSLNSATLNGMATPNGLPSSAWFEWGASPDFGLATSPVSVGAGAGVFRLTEEITSLAAAQAYHCRLVVSNAAGVTRGADQLLVTGATVVGWGDNSDPFDSYVGQSTPPGGLTNAVGIAAGAYHSLAVLIGGNVVGWGDNSDPFNSYVGQATPPGGLSTAVSVAAGAFHSLALQSDGTVVAWGDDSVGETDLPQGLADVVEISAGSYYSVALRSDGTVMVWGTQGVTNIPTGLSNVVSIAAGGSHILALRNDGTVAAWGDNASGQTGVPPGLAGVVAIAGGGAHSLALRNDGTVVAWGDNSNGQTTLPPSLTNVVAISAGASHSLALLSDGTIVAWGQNFYGQTTLPTFLYSAASITAGTGHSLALGKSYDNFADRLPLMGTNISLHASNVGATSEPNEPQHAGFPATNSIWFTWTAPSPGGVQILASADFPSPVLAVYNGDRLSSLVTVASNVAPFNGNGQPLDKARVVFTAVAGTVYQIAVDGLPIPNFNNSGNLEISLSLTEPPSNDFFSNAIPIAATPFDTAGSFIGASRETNESDDGNAGYGQTLWWSWTAPTNLGVSSIPVRLMATAVSFPPGIGVYTGDVVSQLTAVPSLLSQADGMTTMAIFTANPGSTYRIGVAGYENDTRTVNALFGDFRFHLNTRTLALDVLNLTETNNCPTCPITFAADAQIQNLGSAPSNPLRVYVSAAPGGSVRGTDTSLFGIATDEVPQGVWFPTPSSLDPGASTTVHVFGTNPAPSTISSGASSATGYGIYARLQEQPFSEFVDSWFTADQTLVLFGNWPSFNGISGPGGGAIRLDPTLTGSDSDSTTLTNVVILGPTTVLEGSITNFQGEAFFANGTQYSFTQTTWGAFRAGTANPIFSVTNGVFLAGAVVSNTPVNISTWYSYQGVTNRVTTTILVTSQMPTFTAPSQAPAGGTFNLTARGFPSRPYVLQSADSLSTPILWEDLSTNAADTNGIWTLAIPLGTNGQRFYRLWQP